MPSRALLVLLCLYGAAGAADERRESAGRSYVYLREAMDRYHERVIVYEDVSAPGNHFHAWAQFEAGVQIRGDATNDSHSGATSIYAEVSPFAYGGFAFLSGVLRSGRSAPEPSFGDEPEAGVDLRGATKLELWARGARGGEEVLFFAGGAGWSGDTRVAPFPDSLPPGRELAVVLTSEWRRYEIPLAGADLSRVLCGFGWFAAAGPNVLGFYVDDIAFVLDGETRARRLEEPRFVRSFTTEPRQPAPFVPDDFDLRFRNVALTYDNALILLAFLAEGSADGLRRARIIGDAFVEAAANDRFHRDDGSVRIRSAYAAGDLHLPRGWIVNDRARTVAIPGFYDTLHAEFVEVEQASIDTGHNAWVALALLALHERTGDAKYLALARKIGAFLRTLRVDHGVYRGFAAGIDDAESAAPRVRGYASTEQNIVLHAVFTKLGEAEEAAHARAFVEAMQDDPCLRPGTVDSLTRNELLTQLALPAQPLRILGMPGAGQAALLACAEEIFRIEGCPLDPSIIGFDVNADGDAVWLEGTAQMALAAAAGGDAVDGERYLHSLRAAQAAFGDGNGVPTTCRDYVSTGFDQNGVAILLRRRLHAGATAWNALAQLGVNPFTGGRVPAPRRRAARH